MPPPPRLAAPRAPALLTILLVACTGVACTGAKDDSAPPDDTAGETGDTGEAAPASLADADASFVGAPSSAGGSAVAGPGDLDGDGRADVVVAAFYAGLACAWYGPVDDGAHVLTDGACVASEAVYDFTGYAVSGTGDGGLLVSAIGNDEAGTEAGKVYLFRGALPAGTTAAGEAAGWWTGEAAGDQAGTSLAAAGDVDGDGAADVLVGASGVDAGGPGGGRVYLLRGPLADGAGSLGGAWATFTGSSGGGGARAYHGAATGGDALGDAVAGVGDVDGDGLDDLLLGGSGSDAAGEDSGAVWLVRGPVAEGDHRAEDVDARLAGPGPAAYAGGAVAGPGDLDGDGLADLLVAADGWEGGHVYVVLGPVADGDGALDNTFPVLAGDADDDLAGWGVGGADTDGDGRPEVLVGAPGVDVAGEDAGAVYRVRDAAQPGVRLLGEAGERWLGEAAGDAAGRAVAGVGDVDADGLEEVLAGALYNQAGGVFAGKAYLIRGGAP